MGITNFGTYVEKALRWTTSLYETIGEEFETFIDRLLSSSRPEGSADVSAPVYGISVDLSSFCYGVIVNEVKSDRYGVQSYTDAFGDRESAGGPKKQRRDDEIVVVLDDRLIDACAQKCFEKLFRFIGRDSIEAAHYFSLHFDENTTSCKWYEQNRRLVDAGRLVVDRRSRRRVFVETTNLVRARLVFDTKRRLAEKGGGGDAVSDESVHEAVAKKMLLTADDLYSSGEGEWKCFYGVRDLECDAAPEEKLRWYVFGNDSDIGLGVLLYTTANTKVHYVDGAKRVVSFPENETPPNTYKALHFLSLSLMGNDYVPRLVNESAKNMSALGAEVERMIVSQEQQCRTYVELVSRVFRDGGGEEETDRRDTARAIAYVFARLLSAVYNGDDGKRNPNPVGNAIGDGYSSPVDRTSLRCKDGQSRRFTECFAAFSLRVLWYAAYCLFYRHMDARRRRTFQTFKLKEDDFPLFVPGLPMHTCFTYNEGRLHRESSQFALTNLVDVRRAIRELTTPHLMAIMEKGIVNVLCE